LGAHESSPGIIDFGLYLPNITSASKVSFAIKIIHEDDQFIQSIPPCLFSLANTPNPTFPAGDYWTARVNTKAAPPAPLPKTSKWGQAGTYLYRYVATPASGAPIDFIIDPYAREYGVGDLSAITVGFKEHTWSANETAWRTPKLKDMIFYELMINDIGYDIQKAIPMLDYLRDLGINTIEVMPVNNVKNTVNWGYDPIAYFGVDERFGNRADFQQFVDEAHLRGIAVVLDVVYGHTTPEFTFPYLYPKLGIANPFNGPTTKDIGFGPMPDFSQPFVRDYFYTVNQTWLDKFHVDGFRYDNVPAFWDPAKPSAGYGELVATTNSLVTANLGKTGAGVNYWKRFQSPNGYLTLIQCAEYLDDPPAILNNTLSNCTWQDLTLNAAQNCAQGECGAISDLGNRLRLQYFPTQQTVAAGALQQTALQYIENHDHSRFICEFGIANPKDDELLWTGRRDRWTKLQPYLIGLLTARGVPMLWEGQEVCQDYFVPSDGGGRPYMFRPVDWSKFYDPIGQSTIRLVRRLIAIRNAGPQFRGDNHTFYDTPYYNNNGLLMFSRGLGAAFSMIALNFTDASVATTITLPVAGNYSEQIDGKQNLTGVSANTPVQVTIPSNYGQIWTI
jgi:1,4-alpha-glucan branching enzyme